MKKASEFHEDGRRRLTPAEVLAEVTTLKRHLDSHVDDAVLRPFAAGEEPCDGIAARRHARALDEIAWVEQKLDGLAIDCEEPRFGPAEGAMAVETPHPHEDRPGFHEHLLARRRALKDRLSAWRGELRGPSPLR